jgi:hypothetical protein
MSVRSIVATAASCAVASVALFASSPAQAQENRGEEMTTHHKSYESPQNFAIELRLSPFFPNIDSDPSLHGCTPFADIFGTGSSIEIAGEFDWQALRIPHLGTLGPAIGVGTVSFSTSAPSSGARVGSCLKSGSGSSGEQTSLNIYPGFLVAVLRADALWKELGVPFVPYAKAGLGAAVWQAQNTLGTSNYNGNSGQGYTLGTQLALGLSFNLNVFDEYAARNFDEAMGVNSTYLFAEWTDANLDGLWGAQANALRVGGTSWTFGLDWEF